MIKLIETVSTLFVRKCAQLTLILTLLAMGSHLHAQTNFTSNVATGNWNALTSWTQTGTLDLDGVPDANDNVTIANGHTIQINANAACSNLTLNGSGTINFNTNTRTLAVGGNLTMNGTSQIIASADNANRILNVAGNFSVSAGATNARIGNGTASPTVNITGTTDIDGVFSLFAAPRVRTFVGNVSVSGSWTSTALNTAASLIFRNGITASGTFTAGGATFNTNTQAVDGAGTISFANPVAINANVSLSGSGDISFANTVTVGAAITLTNNNTGTVTMSNTGVALASGGAGSTFTQGNTGNTLSYAGSSIGVVNFNATGTNNSVIYTGATPTIFPTNYYNLTYSGTTTGTAVSIGIAGDLTVNSGAFTSSGTVTFNGSAVQTLGGGGTFTFTNLTMNTSGSNVLVNKSITINGTLDFNANGLLVVDANSDITLSQTGQITNFNASRYIQLDGGTGAASQLIVATSAATAGATSWEIIYPIGTATGGYTPMDLTTGTADVAGTNPTAGATLAVKAIFNNSIQGQLRRTFRLIVSGNGNNTSFAFPRFSYHTTLDLSSGDDLTNYTSIWFLNSTAGAWVNSLAGTAPGAGTFIVNAPSHNLSNGSYYYTIGAASAYPNTWYSYQTGVWSDWRNWTLDPSGTTLNNALKLPPQPGDEIVILTGNDITNDVAGQVISSTTIQSSAILDMAATLGNTLGTVKGTGLLRVAGVNAGTMALPTGTYNSFVTAGTGGTIEYYNNTGNLPLPTQNPVVTTAFYNNLILSNSTGADVTVTSVNNLTVSGNFTINATGAGTAGWQINDASNNQRTIILNGDLTVGSGGRISVGGSNANDVSGNEGGNPHLLTIYGNLTNNGIVKFFFDDTELVESDYGLTYPTVGVDLHRNELQGNAVTVTFAGTTSKTVTCNNKTDFYRLILDKGTGQQAILTINSSNTANFRLFGPADMATSETGGTPNYVSSNALSIVNGTLELKGSIDIPVLQVNTSTTGYFPIPRNGALWLNGPDVTVQISDMSPDVFAGTKDGRILISGLLRITDGTLKDGFSKGLGSQDGGSYLQEGGTVSCWQFRPRSVAGDPPFSFTQTGGTLNVGYGYGLSGGKIDSFEEDYARFDLRSANSTFQMSGNAVLNVAKPTSNVDAGVDGGLFLVASIASNISVTGGTVNLYTGVERSTSESYPGYINSTAPFYNLNIYEESATTQNTQLRTNSLVVLNDFTIHTGNTPSFITNDLNVTVGRHFVIESGTTYTAGTGVTTFNGSVAQDWTNDGTITSPLTNVVMSKTGTLTLGGTTHATFINAAGNGVITNLTLTSGTLADNGKTLTVTTALSNSATHSGSGGITYTNAGASAIGGNNGTFGNLTVTGSATHTLSGNQTVTGNLRLTGANTTLDIGSNALRVLGGIYSDVSPGTAVAFGNTKRIVTNGLTNAGGVTRQAADATDLLFPVGTTGIAYTPVTINVDVNNSGGTVGTITVRPVNAVHPNVTTAAQSVRYYWRVTSAGFNLITAVNHKSYIYSTATRDAAAAGTYRVARFDPDDFTWATSNTTYNANAAPGTTTIALGASPYIFNTATAWTGISGLPATKLDGEYTAGNLTAFGTVKVFYSRQSGPWIESTTWSNTAVGGLAIAPAGNTIAGTHFPAANSPVVIGDGTAGNGHTVTTGVAARSCGRLTLDTLATLDCGTVTGHNFGTNSSGAIGGRGRLRIGATGVAVAAMFPGGDFTDFVGPNGGTVEWYGASKTIPNAGPSTNLATYYNFVLNPSAGNTITLAGQNLTVYNDLTQGDQATFTGTVTTNGSRTIAVAQDLNITRGTFGFSNVAASATTLTVARNTTVGTGASFGVIAGGTANANTFTTPGNITNNGTIRFRDTGTVDITFTGSTSKTFGGTGSVAAAPNGTTLNFVTVDKGNSQSASVTFNVGGTVTAANTNVVDGWLRLVNGTFIFATTGTHSIITRNNGDANDAYTIPSTAKLQVNSGTVNLLSAANAFADLLLNGTLEVAGGTVNIAGGTSGNDIEYGAAGTPSIVVSAGALNVNGSIRRSTSVLTGALVYNQTNGTVTVGGYASNNTRGVFEIDANPGSSFTLLGTGTLTVQRQTNGTGYADVFINPITSNVSATSTIAVGLTSATTQANLRVNIAPAIGNFTVLGPGANANPQTVSLFSNAMVLGGNLTITTPSVLNTNSLDVSIAGNLVISGTGTGANAGTYTGGTNTTTFNGTAPQTANLTAVSTFNNITINNTGGATVSLSGTAPTLTNLNILNGVLNVGALGLNVNGNIINNSSQVSTPSGTGSVILAGTATAHTITSSNGSFHNLTFGGSATTKTITLSGNLSVTGALNFATTNRYFNIGSSQLTLGSAATIVGAGTSAFIKTNGVSSDLGVVKTWAVGNDLDFTYAVGTRTNYTPVIFTDLDITAGGTLTVIPVDEQHPTASATGAEILNYYWIVQRNGTLVNVTNAGTHDYQFPTSLIGGSIVGARVGAYLDPSTLVSGTSGWIYGGTFPTPGPPTTMLRFTTTALNFPGASGEFHYSVGTIATLPNPIAPLYSRFGQTISGPFTSVGNLNVGGDWDEVSSWTNSSTGYGPEVLSVPSGRPVYILPGARINMYYDGGAAVRSFGATINGLVVATYAGHSLNTINGTGTLRTSTSTLPAGSYTNFVAAGGGTIEYVGTINMSGTRPVYNNVNIGNATTVGNITPVMDFTLNGNLNVASTSTLNNATNNQAIAVAGNLTNAGTVSQGTGTVTVSGNVSNTGTYNQSSAIINVGGNWSNTGTHNVGTGTVNFNGSGAQGISGTNSFYNLGVSKSGGTVTLNVLTTVTNQLTMTNGTITSSVAFPLVLTSAASSTAGNATSYVSGPMRKTFNGAFTFPVGSTAVSRYRPATLSATSGSDTWTVQYVGNDPSAQSYSHSVFNYNPPANLGKVSQFEYWNISRLGATTAAVELTYNTGSYIPNPTNIGTVANLRVVHWDGSQWDLPSGGGTVSQTGSNVTGTVKVTNVNNFSPFTFGSTDPDSPLPINLLSFNAAVNIDQVDLTWRTAQEINNDKFIVEKTTDLETFVAVDSIDGHGNSKESHSYLLVDYYPTYGRSYYRLKQVDFDGMYTYSEVKVVDYNGPTMASLRAYPNPFSAVKNGSLTIEVTGLKEEKLVPVKVFNLQGQIVFEKVFEVSTPGYLIEKVILRDGAAQGLYIVKAGVSQQLTQKIMVE